MNNTQITDPIEFTHYADNAWVNSTTKAIMKNGARNGRSNEQFHQDCSNGLMLQLAVFEYFKSNGFDVAMEENNKEFDLVVTSENVQHLIDIKGIFKSNSKYFTQTSWESIAVPKYVSTFQTPIHYLCFDCRDGVAFYSGYSSVTETSNPFKPSQFGSGSYMEPRKIKQGLPF